MRCHQLDAGGDDGQQFSKGHNGQLGGRNAPTVFNAAGQIAQFWDGRAPTVEEQAKGPPLNPIEMGMPSGDAVAQRVRESAGYREEIARMLAGAVTCAVRLASASKIGVSPL